MNKVQELIRKLPALCGAKDSWGIGGEFHYLNELENPEPYKRVPGESFDQRCVVYTAFVDHCDDPEKAFYGIRLLALVDANDKGNIEEATTLKAQLSPLSNEFDDVNQILTFEEASKLLAWSPE